jgi:hypothetical protein
MLGISRLADEILTSEKLCFMELCTYLFVYLFTLFFRFDSWRIDRRANRRQNYNTLEVKQNPPQLFLYVLIAGKQFCLLNTGCIKLTHNEKPYLPATSSSFNIPSPQLFHKFWYNLLLKPHYIFLSKFSLDLHYNTIKSNTGLYFRLAEFILPLRIILWGDSFSLLLLMPSLLFFWAILTNICVNLFSAYTMQNVKHILRNT